MAIDTFANLKTAIADTLDRDDLTSHIPNFIALAESRHRRDLRVREMIVRESITINARQIALPTGFLQPIGMRLLTNPVTVLRPVSEDRMSALYKQENGKPQYFYVSNDIEFDRQPDSTYTGSISFYKEETPLSDSNTSNNILANYPDAYLYACLAASAPFLMDDPRIVTWNAFYQDCVQGANNISKRRIAGKMSSRPVGNTP